MNNNEIKDLLKEAVDIFQENFPPQSDEKHTEECSFSTEAVSNILISIITFHAEDIVEEMRRRGYAMTFVETSGDIAWKAYKEPYAED